jgi:4-amino-4-deoxy-L-arabinose transferase-like glycosyltransferase
MTSFNTWQALKKKNDVILYGFLLLYGGVLFFLAFKMNIWEDESYSLHTTSNSLSKVISQSYNFEGQPPGYFIILAIWRKINSGIFFARILSLLFLGLSGFYFYRLVKVLFGDGSLKWMLAVFLLNPFTVWASLEIRLYSMAVFLSTILIYFFVRYFIENKKKFLYAFLTFAIIGLYTQYFFALEIASFAFILLVWKGWKSFFTFSLCLLPVIILFLPNLFFVTEQVEMVQSKKIEYSAINSIFSVLHGPQDLMLALDIVPFNLLVRIIIRAATVCVLLYAYFKLHQRRTFGLKNLRYMDIVVVINIILLCLFCFVIVMTEVIFQSKYLVIALPILILLFILIREFPPTISSTIYCILLSYYVLLLFLQYRIPIKTYDYGKAADFISKNERNDEPLLFYSKGLSLPFSYYYKGSNLLEPLPRLKFDQTYYDENIKDTLAFKQSIYKINSASSSYLLITGIISDYKYTTEINARVIDSCLKNNFRITLDTSILGKENLQTLRIRRLEVQR